MSNYVSGGHDDSGRDWMDFKRSTSCYIFDSEDFGIIGLRAVFGEDFSTVRRLDPETENEGCVCYTARPLPLGHVWQITILDETSQWGGGLTVGLTSKLPRAVPLLLSWNSSTQYQWNYGGTSIWHNGNEVLQGLPDVCNLNVGQSVGFLIAPTGHLHIYIDGMHVAATSFVLPTKLDIWGVVSVCDRATRVNSKLADPLSYYLREALREGSIPHKDDLFLIHGPGGVGKSSLLAMFLDKKRDLNRTSTAVAESALHLSPIVRDMSMATFTDKWELVNIDRQARMVAHSSHHLLIITKEVEEQHDVDVDIDDDGLVYSTLNKPPHYSSMELMPSISTSQTSVHLSPTGSSQSSLHLAPEITSFEIPKQSRKGKFTQFFLKFWKLIFKRGLQNSPRRQEQHVKEKEVENGVVEVAVDDELEEQPQPEKMEQVQAEQEEVVIPIEGSGLPLIPSLRHDPDNIEQLIESFEEGLLEVMKSQSSKELLQYYSIRLVDSGGQPQFHEIVSIILPAVTGIISVFKLSESLDVHGDVVFYKNGVPENIPYNSYLTNEQVIRHDLLTIHSEGCRNEAGEIPSIAFVGTHNDLQHQCPEETPDEKDKLVQFLITDILPEKMQSCIISNGGSLQQTIFRVNAKTPDDTDYEATGRLKSALMKNSHVKPRDLPLKWCCYEVALRTLMEQTGRQILRIRECEFIASKLGFSDTVSLTACLHYLRKYHIISFYDILPKTIFASSQVILDKITELVTYSLKLKSGVKALTGPERKFHQQGILSFSILESEYCSRHYKKGYFTPSDLIKILESLLIITEVSEDEYLLPCVLEVSCIYPFPQPPEGMTQSSFVLHFSKKSPMIGIYCCTISYLLTEVGWKLLKENGEVVQVARNSVTFELPRDLPGKLMFIDPISSYLEVVVEYSDIILPQETALLYNEIVNCFTNGMKQAMKTLNYEVRTPELTFLCPERSQCSNIPHLAITNTNSGLLICSIKRTVFSPLSSNQKMWLEDNSEPEQVKKSMSAPPVTITSQKPNLPDLLQLKVPQQVAGRYHMFGVLLLNDENGNQMEIIKHNCRNDAEAITTEILCKWLTEGRVDITWEALVSILQKCDLSYLAQQIDLARCSVSP